MKRGGACLSGFSVHAPAFVPSPAGVRDGSSAIGDSLLAFGAREGLCVPAVERGSPIDEGSSQFQPVASAFGAGWCPSIGEQLDYMLSHLSGYAASLAKALEENEKLQKQVVSFEPGVGGTDCQEKPFWLKVARLEENENLHEKVARLEERIASLEEGAAAVGSQLTAINDMVSSSEVRVDSVVTAVIAHLAGQLPSMLKPAIQTSLQASLQTSLKESVEPISGLLSRLTTRVNTIEAGLGNGGHCERPSKIKSVGGVPCGAGCGVPEGVHCSGKKLQDILIGDVVGLIGLTKAAELNGSVGQVIGYDEKTARFLVKVEGCDG